MKLKSLIKNLNKIRETVKMTENALSIPTSISNVV